MSDQCQCGKPRPAGGNLCAACSDQLAHNLRTIAERWPDLEAALTRAERGGEKGRTKRGMRANGTNLNEQAAQARRQCSDLVWFALQVIRDDTHTAGRAFNPPRVPEGIDATPTLARWIADWRLPDITHRTAQETAEEIHRDAAAAERATWNAIRERARRVPTGKGCDVDDCPGTMTATITDAMPDLTCTHDPNHVIPPDVWSRHYWRRDNTPEKAHRRLAEAILTR